ncbi:MAG: aminopeptidase P family protein [Sodaliphilus sp.]|nr:aminopeptidase P family protein [Bacteroidales bacterium]MDY2592045.1 aminopeptidase P family protein [Sodaliphilus sp.]MDY2672447.1 aminopeptidase P family protein [Sodaliphilus sp.]MDY2866681.1 aminopeptidase P family protein [Sodaliphilus sp.]MDY5953626.1 aminopeptidase P family protein [Sodaliphilus sp.]
MSKETFPHLEALRDLMRSKHIDAVIIPGTDPHQSEYPSEHWKFRDYVSGFTGSNGTAVVTLDDAGLWTDSRYFLQAAEQLEGSGFTLRKENIPGEPTVLEWLGEVLDEDAVVGVDGRLFSLIEANRIEMFCAQNGFMFAPDFRAAEAIWTDRPARPMNPAFVHDEALAGEDVDSKISRVVDALDAADADGLLITALDEIAWLLNLRGSDVDYTPVVIAFAYVSEDERVLFIDSEKVTSEVKDHLKKYGVKIKDYDDIEKFLGKISSTATVMVDPNRVSDALGQAMICNKTYMASPVIALKGVKNECQIAGFRQAMLYDGAAMVRMMMWLEQNVANGITEMDVDRRLQQERAAYASNRGDSFHMIAGYKDHGAIVHYEATDESAYTLAPDGLLLIDTGGQYLEGTTDITRTISLGNPTAAEKHDYTLILKGHLALARAVFPKGTMGVQLDVLARGPLWNEGMTYLHGTGHGVGHFLGCHEGPQSIRMEANPTPLELGMVTSNEPGIYKTGEYGIRTENLLLCVPACSNEEWGEFYKFESLTLFPYDTTLMDMDMLSREEVKQINDYHAMVCERLRPLLSADEAQWLEQKCKSI